MDKLGFQSCKCDYGTNINCIVLPLKSFILYKTILYGFGGDDEDQADVSCDIVSASGIMIKF